MAGDLRLPTSPGSSEPDPAILFQLQRQDGSRFQAAVPSSTVLKAFGWSLAAVVAVKLLSGNEPKRPVRKKRKRA